MRFWELKMKKKVNKLLIIKPVKILPVNWFYTIFDSEKRMFKLIIFYYVALNTSIYSYASYFCLTSPYIISHQNLNLYILKQYKKTLYSQAGYLVLHTKLFPLFYKTNSDWLLSLCTLEKSKTAG